MNWPLHTRVIIVLPDVAVADAIAPIEVLLQEGFDTFAIAPQADNRAELLEIFGARATFVADQVSTVDDVAHAASFAALMLLATRNRDVIAAADASSVPYCLAGLTPTELEDALARGGVGVQVVPANALSASYAESLPALVDATLVVRMAESVASTRRWLASANVVAVADKIIVDDAFSGGDLQRLRSRARDVARQVMQQFQP